jgi:hypothetical protein
MEGRTQESRSYVDPSYIGDGNPGSLGGGTYTNTSSDPTVQDWENIFGPAARDIKPDYQRHKRHQRWHLPDALVGSNPFIADRIDGLITDATNSPFTSVILPYMYVENPDRKFKWNSMSYDEGLATRVPYESAARVLTQTKRSNSAYIVRHGMAIRMEHNFMMSPKGREDFQNQLRQLVGSIQYSNDLDVHVALITAPSYAKQWAEKYQSVDKTPAQICREFVDLFGFVQKNPNALDILIEESKAVLTLWGSPPPSFMLCNSKLTFQLQMNPDRTNYVSQGPDGVARLRDGPNLSSFRGLSIVNSRAFSMETGAPPRDIMRRRVRVAEYYRIPPQGANTRWEVQLYDESRDTFFSLRKEDLNRLAGLEAAHTITHQLPPDEEISYEDYIARGADFGNAVHVLFPTVANPEARFVKPGQYVLDTGLPDRWSATQTQINNLANQIYAGPNLRRHHYKTVLELLGIGGRLHPNARAVYAPLPVTASSLQACGWVFAHTALFENTCSLLWLKVPVPEDLMREGVLPFLFPGGAAARDVAIQSWAETRENPMCPYQSVMIIALVASLHPVTHVRQRLQAALRDARVSHGGLRSLAARFARACLQPRPAAAGRPFAPATRIQMARVLEECVLQAFRPVIASGTSEAAMIYDQWPDEMQDGAPITHWANVSETHGLLSDPAVEQAYEAHPNYNWNNIPPITGHDLGDLNENQVLVAFLLCATQRFFRDQWELFPQHIPYLDVIGEDNEDYEYVIVRPCIEHNMLGIILARGGGPSQLGATLWGQTELSCYDDSYYGTWGLSYKYHTRALVFNERNLIRLWDVCYDGYNGGKDDTAVRWAEEAPGMDRAFNNSVTDMSVPYTGPSLMVMRFKVDRNARDYRVNWPSPIVFHDKHLNNDEPPRLSPDPESIYVLQDATMRVFNSDTYREQYRAYLNRMPDFSYFHQVRKPPGQASVDMETSQNALAFQGTYRIRYLDGARPMEEINGSGHHGPDYIGCAAVRAGKGSKPAMGPPQPMRMV